MIPFWVWRYAPHAIGAALLGLIVAFGIHRAKEQVRAELEPKIENLEAQLEAERADRARAEAAANAYRSEIDALRSRPVPRTPVRLCVEAPAPMPAKTPSGVVMFTGENWRCTAILPPGCAEGDGSVTV